MALQVEMFSKGHIDIGFIDNNIELKFTRHEMAWHEKQP